MRQLLLGGLTSNNKRNKDLQQSSGDELDVQFGVGFGEDIGEKLIERKQAKKERDGMTPFEKWQEKKSDRKREKKKVLKQKQKEQRQIGRMTEHELIEHNRKKAELELLIAGRKSSQTAKEFVDKDDSRFKTADSAFAIDPTHKEYRKKVQGHNKIGKK